MIDFIVATDKLRSLETSHEVAAFLYQQGVKAVPEKGAKCAISQWVSDVTGRPVFTTYEEILVVDVEDDADSFRHGEAEEIVDMTPAMTKFVRDFDNKLHPHLIDWDGVKRLNPSILNWNGTERVDQWPVSK